MHIYTRNLANAALSIRVTLNTKPDGRFWLLHNLNRNLVSRQTDWIVAGRGSSLLTWPNPRSMMDQTRHDQKLKWNSGPDSFCTTCRKNLLTLILQLIKQVVKTFWRQAASQGRIFSWEQCDVTPTNFEHCSRPAAVPRLSYWLYVKVETNWTHLFRLCRKDEISLDIVDETGNDVEATVDFVERIVRLVAFDNVASTMLLVWTGLYATLDLPRSAVRILYHCLPCLKQEINCCYSRSASWAGAVRP